MKTSIVVTLCLFVACQAAFSPAAEFVPAADVQFEVADRGPHHNVWTKTVQERLPDGTVAERTHSYTELATGANYWDGNAWVPSTSEIEIINGNAVARHGQIQVIWSPNSNVAGAVDAQSMDKRFQSAVLGIAYTSRRTGASFFVANPRDCIGEVAGNAVIYRNAFDAIPADIVYVYSPAGLEQNIVLKQALPDPAQAPWNLDPSTVSVEIYTEFINPSEPVIATTVLQSETDPGKRPFMVEPDMIDSRLDFGATVIGLGTAFLTGVPGDAEKIPVAKSFEIREQTRRVLIEKVDYAAIQKQLAALPHAAIITKERMAKVEQGIVRDKNGIPKLRLPKLPVKTAKLKSESIRRMASLEIQNSKSKIVNSPAFVIDYSQLNTMTGAVLRADQTYYISSAVSLSSPITFEGGAVIKFAPTNSASLKLSGAVTFLTSPTRMVHLTARDDHSIGEQIGTNALSGYYANPALELNGGSYTIPYFRVSYASLGVKFFGGGRHVVTHSQIVNCDTAFLFYFCETAFRNVLACSINTVATSSGSSSTTSRWEHVTLDQVNDFNSSPSTIYWLTNSLLVAVTNNAWAYGGGGANNGSSNASANVFQTVGGGSHYLLANSPFRDAGSSIIDPTLASELKQKTTYGPNLYTNSITTNTTLDLIAQRDTDTPDIGWHAEPIDWAVSGVIVSNATLTVQPGITIATSGSDQGFVLDNASSVIAEGYPTNLIRFVRYNTIQEQAITNWSSASPGYMITGSAASLSNYPGTRFRFTDWSVPGGGPPTFYGSGGSPSTNAFRDSQFHGGRFDSLKATVYLTNCLFERVAVTVNETSPFDLLAYNNTFYGGSLDNRHTNTGTWRLRNNLFDKAVITNGANIDNAYSGYVTGASKLTPTNTFDIIQTSSTNISFQTSWLGRFYLPSSAVYTNKGSTNADLLTLYHFTTQTNQVKETNSIVDIGFHYVAVNSNGIPIDTDGDGIPDYQEDANGNGTVDPGETNWLAGGGDSDGDLVSDYIELLLGRNPLVKDTTNDFNGSLNLRVYTPLR